MAKQNNQQLPVTLARSVAITTFVMSLGSLVVLAVFFLSSLFDGILLAGVILAMAAATCFSAHTALRKLCRQFLCSRCRQPFFTSVPSMLGRPDCAYCGCSFADGSENEQPQ